MICPDFTEVSLRSLLEVIQGRAITFAAQLNSEKSNQLRSLGPNGNVGYTCPIFLRFDIDDDLTRALRMMVICSEYGIRGTFFILNTATYWTRSDLMPLLKEFGQDKGHEIAWHNNLLSQMRQWDKHDIATYDDQIPYLNGMIKAIIGTLATDGLTIRGSASHGDPMCHRLGYLNYEIFKECPRTQEAINFPKPSFTIPQVSMHDFGLEYEAYHVPYDLYLSESGGRAWNKQFTADDLAAHDRIQILIHPQHWKI